MQLAAQRTATPSPLHRRSTGGSIWSDLCHFGSGVLSSVGGIGQLADDILDGQDISQNKNIACHHKMQYPSYITVIPIHIYRFFFGLIRTGSANVDVSPFHQSFQLPPNTCTLGTDPTMGIGTAPYDC